MGFLFIWMRERLAGAMVMTLFLFLFLILQVVVDIFVVGAAGV